MTQAEWNDMYGKEQKTDAYEERTITIDKDTVAICMATYNGERFLREQIDSILAQSWKNWILFIRDDGSGDQTPELLRAYAASYPERIVLIDEPELKGGSAKKNFALILNWVKARYDFGYFMFSDQDDVWLEHKITVCMKRMKREEAKQEGPVLIHTDLKVVDQELNLLGESFFAYRALDVKKKDLRHLLVQNNLTGCTMLWNRRFNEWLDLENDAIAMHDWWMALAASSFGRIVCIRQPTILYRQHGDNVVGATRVNTLSFILKRLAGNAHVKEVFQMSVVQARFFLKTYRKQLSKEQIKQLEAFTDITNHRKPVRLWIVLKGGYWKQGIVQIIGELLFL